MTEDGGDIYVHSKVTIIDGEVIRILRRAHRFKHARQPREIEPLTEELGGRPERVRARESSDHRHHRGHRGARRR